MPHLAGRCACGRKLRFPKGSTYGTKWTCWKCGKTYTLAPQGNPLHTEGSQAPTSTSGCLLALAFLVSTISAAGLLMTVFVLKLWS